jgi:excisionase family DNA binding protein
MSDASPLFVRLAAAESRRLEQAVAATGLTKRRLVEDAVREHLREDGLVVGHAALHEAGPEVLTPEEAAAFLRLDAEAVLDAARGGELPARKLAGEWRFSRAALLAWLGGS